MTIHSRPATHRPDSPLSQTDFDRIAKIAKSGWGLNLEKAKMPLIQSRLGKRLKALQLGSFAEYCDILEKGNSVEVGHFVNALTTNVTHFYRELHHFEMLEQKILPGLISRARSGEKIRIWSAGCSSGQEPYSLAGSILSCAKDAERLDFKILATDVDTQILQRAETGEYSAGDCNFPSENLRARVFDRTDATTLSVRPALRQLITFRQLNLVGHWPITGKFDVIMCRNVAIYFDRSTQERLWSRFSDAMKPGGQLFIGHSERIVTPEKSKFTTNGVTSYRRHDASDLKTHTLEGS